MGRNAGVARWKADSSGDEPSEASLSRGRAKKLRGGYANGEGKVRLNVVFDAGVRWMAVLQVLVMCCLMK